MNAHRDPDRWLDEALKHELGSAGAAPASASCLDAETVAAWMDGGLDSQAVAMAEAHASNCARCQALLGILARTTPAVVATEPQGARLWRWWFAPLAASAAAAVTLWMVVPREPAPTPASAPIGEAKEMARADLPAARSEPTQAEAQAAPAAPLAATTPPPPAAARERANAAVPAPAELGTLAGTRDTRGLEELARKTEAPARADSAAEARVAAAAPPPAAAPPATALLKQADPLADPQVTARSTPSPGVIWLVGRAGMVQLATDGRTFARVPFPEAVDLTAVTATDERHATVTTADGRTFQTADGGRTWQRP